MTKRLSAAEWTEMALRVMAAEGVEAVRVEWERSATQGVIERAIRAWAAHDESAAKSIARVDAKRYDFVRGLLEAYGLPKQVAAIRARLLYTSLVGEQHTSLRLSRDRRIDWALRNLELLLRAP
jgi:hypothetical protein